MKRFGLHLSLIMLSLAMAFPLFWMVGSSMKPSTEILANPMSWPTSWSFDPFVRAWEKGEFSRHFLNSIFVTGSAVLGVVLFSSMGGFALARFKLPGANFVRALLVIGLLLPVEGILIALHGLTEYLNMQHTHFALILPYIALELPIALFLFQAFFSQIPREIEEAARMDGCNSWQLYWRVFLPMGAQVVGVVSILTFLAFWNEFLLANFLINNDEVRTMPSAFNNFYGRHKADYQLIFAGLSVYVVPAVVFYIVMSRWITKSVTAGALKG